MDRIGFPRLDRRIIPLTPHSKWVATRLGTSPRNIRTDRIVQEVLATGGDILRICDMFCLSVEGAGPCVAVLSHPDPLTQPRPARPRLVVTPWTDARTPRPTLAL